MKQLIICIGFAISSVALHGQADLWLHSTDFINEYYRVPAMNAPVMHFGGKVENIGNAAASNITVSAEVYNSSSALVYSAVSSTTATLNAGDSLTFSIPSYTPPAIVDEYRVVFTANMSAADPNQFDNVFVADSFYVTDSVWARDNDIALLPISCSGNAGGFLGQQFVLTQPAALTSISGYLLSNGTRDVSFVVFPYNNGRPGNLPIASTDTVSVTSADDWVTIPLKNGPLYLPADTFVIAARQFGSVWVDLWISYGNYTPASTWVKWQSITWTNIETYGSNYAFPFMLRANIAEPNAVDETSVNGISLITSPNPTQGLVTLSYDFGTSCDAVIEVYNPLGQTIITSKLFSVQSGQTVLDLQHQPAGTYMIAVTTGGQRSIMEVIVK